MTLPGRTAVITGASSGIGEAVARNLCKAGVKLLLTARRERRLRSLADQLPATSFLAGDLTDPDLPQRLIGQALEDHGSCDIMVSNAGMIETGSIEEIDLERISRMVRINIESAFRLAYVALRHFRSVGQGHLIHTSSLLGTKVREGAGAYSGTKFALEALSEALRLELAGTGIQVTCIEPGLVRTELHEHYEVHPAEALGMSDPLQPEDVARCVRFVLEQPPHVRIPRLMVLPGEGRL
ncbi:MAG: SDR family oxidoreductase [Acidobacteriota bacterium]